MLSRDALCPVTLHLAPRFERRKGKREARAHGERELGLAATFQMGASVFGGLEIFGQ